MTQKKPPVLSVAFALLAAASTSAFAINGKPAVDRDTIVFGIGKEIGNLDGQVAASGDSQRYLWQIYDALYAFDTKGNLKPNVATKVDIAADGLSYTFELRKDVTFHNGAKLTASDVKYSLERILDPNTRSTRRPYFADLVTGVEAQGDSKVVFKLSRPDGAFLNKVAGYLTLVPRAYTESLPNVEAFARAPVGSGPYKFVEQKIGQSVTLERNEAYWGAKPGIKKLIFKSLPEPASRVNAVLTGEADIVDYVPTAEVERLRKTAGLNLASVQVGRPLAVRLYSNVEGTPLAKRDVRLALNHGLDAKAIIDNVLKGVGAPLASYISSSYPYGVDKALKPYAYDPARAKRLLSQAGYPQGFSTDFYCSSDNPKELCEAIAAYWSQIGVKANIKVIDYAAWSRLNNTHKNGPMTMMQFSNAIYDPIHPIGGGATKAGTWSDYFNPEVEKLVEQAQTTTDRAQRDEIFKKIGRTLHDDGHAVLVTEMFYTYARDSQIQWEIQQGSGYFNLHNIGWKK
ncbi:ABC transporter substrate-binding protein [Variovorax sp. KK3]|uniref:ABC transporter substrate-binding protein n=1 Tax=Variovorax sp. KK3 TaxID=1855728 RepID=UPI00097BAAB8|nr:ABC transporter substrate-binding protein [Variovorax sp. KK3]